MVYRYIILAVCLVGQEILEVDGVYVCEDCPIDYIQPLPIPKLSESCTSCPQGSGTNSTGSTECIGKLQLQFYEFHV